MSFNVFLAVVPVFFGLAMYKSKTLPIRLAAAIIWLIFLPNTVYLLTDPVNLFNDATQISGIYLLVDIFMYLVLLPIGVITYILSINYFEKIFITKKTKKDISSYIYLLNFLVGFGLVLGRILRLNSWEAFTNFEKVIYGSLSIVKSVELMVIVFVFAIFSQIIYLKFKKSIIGIKR